jgi:hypothetical protein
MIERQQIAADRRQRLEIAVPQACKRLNVRSIMQILLEQGMRSRIRARVAHHRPGARALVSACADKNRCAAKRADGAE